MKNAFTLVEVLIVVAILGIIAAVIIPECRNYTQKARESTAKENLQILRTAIERYAIEHNGVPPGYPENDRTKSPHFAIFSFQMISQGYLPCRPQNPFNDKDSILILSNDIDFPSEPTGQFGWIYRPATKESRIDWPGTDSEGISYYNY